MPIVINDQSFRLPTFPPDLLSLFWQFYIFKSSRVGDCAAADDYIDEVLANVAKMVVEQV